MNKEELSQWADACRDFLAHPHSSYSPAFGIGMAEAFLKLIEERQEVERMKETRCRCAASRLPGNLGHLPSCPAYRDKK